MSSSAGDFPDCPFPWTWGVNEIFDPPTMANIFPEGNPLDLELQHDKFSSDVGENDSGRVMLPWPSSEGTDHQEHAVGDQDNHQPTFTAEPTKPGRERKRGSPWTVEEHRRFLIGLAKYGKGDWRSISRKAVITKTPTQVASHAQKYFIRQGAPPNERKRASIHDITSMSHPQHSQGSLQGWSNQENGNQLGSMIDPSFTLPQSVDGPSSMANFFPATSMANFFPGTSMANFFPRTSMANFFPGTFPMDLELQHDKLFFDVSEIDPGQPQLPWPLSASTDHQEHAVGDQDIHQPTFNAEPTKPGSERKRGSPWTEEEHRRFLLGLEKYGKGDWRSISRKAVISKTSSQVASHAQKYFIRQGTPLNERKRASIHDITSMADPQDSQGSLQGWPMQQNEEDQLGSEFDPFLALQQSIDGLSTKMEDLQMLCFDDL